MIFGTPHRYLVSKSAGFRKFVIAFSSEQWSCTGFLCLVLTSVAGYFHHPYLYTVLLFVQEICDINDGFVYREKEKGIQNGYGLYIDHILDSIGASFTVLGGYFLLGTAPLACGFGLILYYLIAIHSWLYKINKVSEGQLTGAYYGIPISRDNAVFLNVDDLTVMMSIIVISRSVSLLYFTDSILAVILISKITRATLELRSTRWLQIDPP